MSDTHKNTYWHIFIQKCLIPQDHARNYVRHFDWLVHTLNLIICFQQSCLSPSSLSLPPFFLFLYLHHIIPFHSLASLWPFCFLTILYILLPLKLLGTQFCFFYSQLKALHKNSEKSPLDSFKTWLQSSFQNIFPIMALSYIFASAKLGSQAK